MFREWGRVRESIVSGKLPLSASVSKDVRVRRKPMFCSFSIRPPLSCLLGGFCSVEFINNNNNNNSITRSWVRNMASEAQQFPPQKQQAQPGKQHAMDPTPQFTTSDYKPANKLQAPFSLSFPSYYFALLNIILIIL
ncbi:unnamed protein product [Citrullus colocynthis]|uniref:Uncharacterized protein n=1 Tax=Citrullus colocynthis TaxID=252529 RepID=A0ABP0YD71_9ROSI